MFSVRSACRRREKSSPARRRHHRPSPVLAAPNVRGFFVLSKESPRFLRQKQEELGIFIQKQRPRRRRPPPSAEALLPGGGAPPFSGRKAPGGKCLHFFRKAAALPEKSGSAFPGKRKAFSAHPCPEVPPPPAQPGKKSALRGGRCNCFFVFLPHKTGLRRATPPTAPLRPSPETNPE